MRIHKQLDAPFLRLVAAVLFVAACTWLGAELYGALLRQSLGPPAPEPLRELPLEGVAVRQELLLCARRRMRPLAESGKRLARGAELAVSAGGRALCAEASGVFFADWDGLEYLSLAPPEKPDVAAVQALLDSKPKAQSGAYGRLVLAGDWYFAALVEAGSGLQAGARCRLRFEGIDRPLDARLLSVSPPDGGRQALLLRLTEGGADCLSLRKCRAWLLSGEDEPLMLEKNKE